MGQGNFDQLERTAAQLRSGRERLPGGAWKLNAFYSGLNEPAAATRASESEWQLHLGKLRQWVERNPTSITARVALGDALVNYAWAGRGEGYTHTVSEERLSLYRERLAQAEAVMSEAAGSAEKCPHWYVTMLRIGLGARWEADRFERIFAEGVALEPTYYYLHRVKAMYLMPRWHGRPGEWECFAEEAAQRIGGREGSSLYYMIASHIRTYYGRRFLADNQVSWPRMRQGYADLEAVYGTDARRLNEVCQLATLAEDWVTARDLFARIGEDYDSSIWRSRTEFDMYRSMARQRAGS